MLFGRSGLGKSSLLKAGVFPRLRELGFVPIYIRLHFRDAQLGLTEQVRAYFEQELREQRIEYPNGPPTSRCGSSSTAPTLNCGRRRTSWFDRSSFSISLKRFSRWDGRCRNSSSASGPSLPT